jgi:hypothetical protein
VIWATRRRCHVDRAGSAWLIRRYVDREAEFRFVDDPDDVPADAIPFDMRGAALSHHDGRCTFETLLAVYDLEDPVLVRIGQIVHEADLEDERFDAPEARGLDVLVRGLGRSAEDHELLRTTDRLFDALYAELDAAASPERAVLD